jgi:RNA polymerase sigma-70 factor (ECF subfamily)
MSLDDAPSSLRPLLDRHQLGDAETANAIILHCQDRLKRLTRRMLRRFPDVHRWEQTSDVFHNVVLRLATALRALTPDTPTDFLRLAACHIRRELIDLSRHRRPVLVGSTAAANRSLDPVAGKPDTTNDPYNLAAWAELHSRIAALPDEDRRLFDLLYYQGLTQPEAAGLLGVPLRSLKRAWQHARIRLMRDLGNDAPL